MNVSEIVALALAEDIGPGDITSQVSIPEEARANGAIVAKADGVLAGIAVAEECFRQVDERVRLEALLQDGEVFRAGAELAKVLGPARSLLAGERVALNFLQRLCGTATLTRAFVNRIKGTKARIVDTRKTTPGLRALEKMAVRVGGGQNHRFALYDGILLKDNHVRIAGGVASAVQAAKSQAPHLLKLEVEVSDLAQLAEAIEAGADAVLLDNMSLEDMAEAVKVAAGRVLLEASGGVSLNTVADIAATGVDLISVGALTHSARAIDISMEIEPLYRIRPSGAGPKT